MSVPRYWREIPQRYRLETSRCKKCGVIQFPPFSICPKCRSTDIGIETCPETGKLLTYTVVWVPPAKFSDQAPYGLGIIELDNGARITAQMTDCNPDDLAVGMRVQAVFRRINTDGPGGLISYGCKFRPIDSLKTKSG